MERSERLLAVLAYPAAVVLWVFGPLAVYLAAGRTSRYVRWHAAQAGNLIITTTLFTLCGVIVWGLLALDTATAALAIVGPLVCALWLVVLAYLVRAAIAASRGERYAIPAWLCAPLLR